MTFPNQSLPGRIVVKSSDGVVRFLSPINARSITATYNFFKFRLPLTEGDMIEDIAYHRTLGYTRLTVDRLFVMLKGGDIIVFRADQNPCN